MRIELVNWSRIAPGVYVGIVGDAPEPRFEIRRKVYDLPRGTAWRLYDSKGALLEEAEQLAHAKEWAEDMIADPEDGDCWIDPELAEVAS